MDKPTIKLNRINIEVQHNLVLPVECVELVPVTAEDDNEEDVAKNAKESSEKQKNTFNIKFKFFIPGLHQNLEDKLFKSLRIQPTLIVFLSNYI